MWREERQPPMTNDDESYDAAPPSSSPAASPGDAGSVGHAGGPSDSDPGALKAQMAELGFGEEEILSMTDEQKQEIVSLLSSIEKLETNSKWASEFQFSLCHDVTTYMHIMYVQRF